MDQPLLSICIPTFNRENYLAECLESIVVQFTDPTIQKRIEIVISDNGSSDNTHVVVERFQKQFENIIYIRNKENIGFDRNLLQVVEKSSGMYCLTLGDDDALFSGSLTALLKKVETNESPYYMLNPWGYDKTLLHPAGPRPNFDIKNDKYFSSLLDFVKSIKNYRDVVGYFGSMSTQFFLRSTWMHFDKKANFIGTNTVHLFILLSAFKDQKFVLLAEPMIKTRNNNLRWHTYPGLETSLKRLHSTLKTLLWISNLYHLNISRSRAAIYMYSQLLFGFCKAVVKLFLIKIGLRK